MVEKKDFVANPNFNIVHPNAENMIIVPIRKSMEVIMSIQVCHISLININYTKKGGKNSFLINLKHQYRVSQSGERDCGAHNETNGDYNEYSSLSHFTDETLIIRKMEQRKAFLSNPKHQYLASQSGEHDCNTHNEKNRDYNEYPSLSLFTDEH